MCPNKSELKLHVRITREEDTFVDRLVSSGTYKNRSSVLRTALEELIARYTGTPTLSGLDEQVKRLRFRMDGYDEDMRVLRRQLEEMKK